MDHGASFHIVDVIELFIDDLDLRSNLQPNLIVIAHLSAMNRKKRAPVLTKCPLIHL